MSNSAKRLWMIVSCCLIFSMVLLFVTARHFTGKFEPEIRRRVIVYLEKRFDGRAKLAKLRITIPNISPLRWLFHRGGGAIAHVEGEGLSLSFEGRDDLPPLFAVDSFAFDLDLGILLQPQPRIAYVSLTGMTIVLPPKSQRPTINGRAQSGSVAGNVMIDEIDISHARLVVVPNRADAKPLDFPIESIHLRSAARGQPLLYQATLTNPRPPGQIRSQGTFGPWNGDSPGDTPLAGDYDFSHADLSVFKTIAGILHSSGHFVGTLSAVRAQGEATVPDFRLASSGNPVPLQTKYAVIVDGTNGNTVLQPVHARLRNTEFQTSGGVIKREKEGRRAINLAVVMPHGHIEDLLLLAAKGRPFMSGVIRMNARISIPPLAGTVREKLFLTGAFDIAKGNFPLDAVQDKIDELSRRGQGRPQDQNVDNVFSSMTGAFRLENQVMTFSRLNFAVPGAAVGIHGSYRMADDVLDFHGDLRLQAKVSQTLNGWKRWLAKPLDPFFAKNGVGTFLKIQVVGSAKSPQFGRDRASPASN